LTISAAFAFAVADTSIFGIRVARELDRLVDERGKPKTIVSDNGTELTSNAILRWADDYKLPGTTPRPRLKVAIQLKFIH
jgi:transposase InsO family protein